MARLSSFPHLSTSEFEDACAEFLKRFEQHSHLQSEWLAIERIQDFQTPYLQITKALAHQEAMQKSTSNQSEEDEIEEEHDEEALNQVSDTEAIVRYDVILSSTYQVPTLYISIKDTQHRFPPTIDTLYGYIVPPLYRSQAKDFGVLGGITITDHPVEGRPVFFIHPCRTAEVMQASAGGRDVNPEEYLLIWIGALGKCVGLDISMALAACGNASKTA